MKKSGRPDSHLKRPCALKGDGVDTILVGWTPLGHLELQRKRERPGLGLLLHDGPGGAVA